MASRLPLRCLVLAATLAAACSIEVDDVASRECSGDTGCPELYRCAQDVEGKGRCEVIYPPSSSSDAGTSDDGG